MSANNQPKTPPISSRSTNGRFLTVLKTDPSPFEAPPLSVKSFFRASDSESAANVDSREQREREEASHDADASKAGHSPRRSEDTERFLDGLRKLEDGADPKAAPLDRDGQREGNNSMPKPKIGQVVAKDTRGMDFFDQLDAMEGGYFPPM